MDGDIYGNEPIETGAEGNAWDNFWNDPDANETDVNTGTEDANTDIGNDPEGAGTEGGSMNDPTNNEGAGTEPGGGDPNSDEGNEPGFTAEQQAAIAAQAQKQVDNFYKQQYAGFINPYTHGPIESEADYLAYMQAFEAEERQRKFGEMGVDPNVLNQMINDLPAVKQANAIIAQQQQAQANAFMNDQFDALKREYPDCGFADARAMMNDPEGRKVLEFWRDSPRLSIADAYMILNKDKIKAQQNAAVKQGVMNQMNGKNHLKQTKAGGGAAVDIPESDREALRKWFPKASDAELKEMWLKNQKYSEK